MAAFGNFDKPRMLRTLLRDYVPLEKQPSSSPQGLPKVASAIQTYKLLSESFPGSMEPKLVENWKSAIDDWIDRLLSLVSSNMPDKCWAGVCLMGITCQECSSDRFLASYSVWMNKLLPHIQQPIGSQIVKEACCTSISDLLNRLSRFPQAKKDGNLHAGKLIQPVIKLLNENSSESVWEGTLTLLRTIIFLFPAALQSYSDRVETAIASRIFSGDSSDSMLKNLALCLALLPKARGDEDSWSLMMQRLLLSINEHLTFLFQGLEEESKGKQAVRLLVPPGKDHPPPLGGKTGVLNDGTSKSEHLIVSRISALMCCCCTMLTSSYQVQVNVPIRALLALSERVLAVDGSLPKTMMPFMIAAQELISVELKDLHSYALDVLVAAIKSLRSQLLPHAASILRLVTSYFRKCSLPELRIKLYSITKILLMSMGVGMAMHLEQEIISNASADLKPISIEGCDTSSNENAPRKGPIQPCSRKRKHSVSTGDEKQLENSGPNSHSSAPISVKIAALEALGTLLAVGGALRSEGWRSSIDGLIITMASHACNRELANMEANHFHSDRSTSSWADFQLAAFRALEVSLLAPARVRPAYLAQALELFQTGKQDVGTKLSEFCAHALLHMEVLIHPRALPLDDLPTFSNRFPENSYFNSQKYNAPNSSDIPRTGNNIPDLMDGEEDDELFNKWLKNGDSEVVPTNAEDQRVADSVYPSESKRLCGEQEISKNKRNLVVESENVPEQPVALPQELPASEEVTATIPNDTEMKESDRLPEKDGLPDSEEGLALNPVAALNLEMSVPGDDSDDGSRDSFPGLKDEDFVTDFEASSDSESD